METPLNKILSTYTHIVSSIKSCKTLVQLKSCDAMIETLKTYKDRSDVNEWIKAVDETYLKKREEILTPQPHPQITSMKVVSDVGAMCDEQPSDNCTH